MKEIYIVDALNFLFRSYYAIRQMTNKEGKSTNALFGFIRSILRMQKDFSPTHLICVFDGPNNKASRSKIYKEYKGHREKMPDDLFPQIDLAKRFCEAAGLPYIEVDGVEADDTIGTIAKWAEKKGAKSFICSSDKDLCQIVNDHILILQTYKENTIVDRKGVIEKFGVTPEQIVDYLAIIGDASDNIPGIQGFGAKTAVELLQTFGTLKNILDHPEKQSSAKRQEKIIAERENALLSQQLATLDLSVKIPTNPSDYELRPPHTEKLIALYQEMNFQSLLKELAAEKPPAPSIQGNWRLVNSKEELLAELKKIEGAKEICIDTETTSIDPMQAQLVGIGISTRSGDAFYVPLNGNIDQAWVLEKIGAYLTQKGRRYVGHNIKYDMHVLSSYGIDLSPISFDTMIASYLLNAGENRHNLERLILEHFDVKVTSYDELVGAGSKKTQKTIDQVEIEKVANYCCEDADYTLRLKGIFSEILEKRKLMNLFEEIEMPLLPILYKMEHAGIFVDRDQLSLLSKEFRKKIEVLQQQIFDLSQEEFNLNSPKQLSEVLFTKLGVASKGKRTKTGYSTSADVLEELRGDHPIVDLILEYRTLEKLRSTYVDSLSEQINPETGRIHCSFNQSVTATGRLSSTNPNLQNIPIRSEEGRRIREAFRPQKPNWSFVGADYSQIELRILAHFCGDERLVSAFNHGEDIHIATAAKVFGVTEKEVTKEMRFQAKAVNFGLIYGQSAFGLSKELGIGVGEAARFIEKYFATYPKVKEFLEYCIEKGKKEGKATSMFGRERLLPEINGRNQVLRAQAFRFAVNTPIQGTQSDIMKKTMIDIDRYLSQSGSRSFCVLQIHDELIFECPDDEIAPLQKKIAQLMESTVKLKVPLKVDISVGKNWGEC